MSDVCIGEWKIAVDQKAENVRRSGTISDVCIEKWKTLADQLPRRTSVSGLLAEAKAGGLKWAAGCRFVEKGKLSRHQRLLMGSVAHRALVKQLAPRCTSRRP